MNNVIVQNDWYQYCYGDKNQKRGGEKRGEEKRENKRKQEKKIKEVIKNEIRWFKMYERSTNVQ